MSELRVDDLAATALTALADGALPVSGADVPSAPGLYAIFGAAVVWQDLGLGRPPDGRPLYVGKSESSLAARDLKTHFADGRTGSSTVRRSLAALLVDRLGLIACPRNLERPDHFSHYALEPDSDARLSAWMREHLTIAVWRCPSGAPLDAVETEVLLRWVPPLNGSKVKTPWRAALRAARARMAAAAEGWG